METKEILKQLRESKGYSIQDVSERTEISYSVYQKYESGARGVGVPALSKLADFYGVSTDYLLGREPEENTSIQLLAKKYNMTAQEEKILNNYLSLEPDTREKIMRIFSKD